MSDVDSGKLFDAINTSIVIVYYFILCKNITKYLSVILLQQDLHGNTVSRLFNINSYFVIFVTVTVISFI